MTALLLACASGCRPDAREATDSGTADASVTACAALPAGVTAGELRRDGGEAQQPVATLVLMGGGAEVDSAAKAFVEGASGGDVLVLRATGSVDSYTPYFFEDLGAQPAPASVVTLRIDDATASGDPAVRCRVERAAAAWLAGGDQWDYVGTWDHSTLGALVARSARVSVGGTSAGAMALGGFVFSARLGSVTSAEALADPSAGAVEVLASPLGHPWMTGVVVDTHFTQRSREGRLLVFAARALALAQGRVLAVGLDEESALVITGTTFRVEGPGAAWMYRVDGPAPAIAAGQPLDLQGVARQRFTAGATGQWPPDVTGEALEVRAGVVIVTP